MSDQIILRIKSNYGQNRISVSLEETLLDLKKKIQKALNLQDHNSFSLNLDSQNGQLISMPDQNKLKLIKNLEHGSFLWLQERPQSSKLRQRPTQPQQPQQAQQAQQPQQAQQTQQSFGQIQKQNPKCNHGPNGKCFHCTTVTKEEIQVQTQKCQHGPNGKCFHCTEYVDKQPKGAQKFNCNHGPNGKCIHCQDSQYVQDAKHISFEDYLTSNIQSCKHAKDQKCTNCTPSIHLNFKLNLNCKNNHQPYPLSMCNKCMPAACVVKRQVYRHVDYAQIMNQKEIQNFLQPWIKSQYTEQRIGFLYGYYCEDPNYKKGVRAIIEAVYEPPQKGGITSVDLLQDPFEPQLQKISEALGFERIGWILTDSNSDLNLDSKSIRKAAHFQEHHVVQHPSGIYISNFLTMVVRPKKGNFNEIAPEVYMVSDQAQALERDEVFDVSDSRKMVKIRNETGKNDVVCQVICQDKSVKEVDPDFFIVNIAHGTPNTNKFSLFKQFEFPIENRQQIQQMSDVKNYLKKNNQKDLLLKYSDFHFLLYIAKVVDIDTALTISKCIYDEKNPSADMDNFIKQLCKF